MFTRLALLACCLSLLSAVDTTPPAAPLAVISDDAAWQVLPQHPLSGDQAPAPDAAGWLALGTYRSRDYQLANRREPGLGLWLQTTIKISELPPAGSTVVLALANALIADGAVLNGTLMANQTFTSNRPFPHDQQTLPFGNRPADAPIFARWDDPKNIFWTKQATLDRDFASIRPPLSALFSVPVAALRPGTNRLQLAVYEQSVNTMFPGPVVLRRATLADRIQLNSFTRSTGDTARETVLLVQHTLPGPEPVAFEIEMQDALGAVLWREPVAIDWSRGPFQQALPLVPRSRDDYKAVIRIRSPGQEPVSHWATLHQARRQPTTFRERVAITATIWEYRRIAQDEAVVYPPPGDKWQAGKPGTGAPDYKHRSYVRTRFTVPADLQPGRIELEVGELKWKGDFYLNGASLGTRRYYECPFTLDVSSALKLGEANELVVALHDATTPEFVSEGFPPTPDGTKNAPPLASRFHFDYHDLIKLKDLSILSRPAIGIDQTRIVTSVATQSLTVSTSLVNPTTAPLTLTPEYAVLGRAGEALRFRGAATIVPAGSSAIVTTKNPWRDAARWSPESPTLYHLVTTVWRDGTAIDATRERFGFREVGIRGRDVLLNGEVLRFRTLAPGMRPHHAHWPDAYSYNTFIANLRAAKDIGFNSFRIRDHHYVREFYDACDEIGLACGILSDVVDNHNTKLAFTDPVTWDNSLLEMAAFFRDRGNRPAVLWYDLGNENISYAGPSSAPKVADLVYRNEQRVRAMDPTRLVFSSGTEGGYDGRAMIFSPHYPGFNNQNGAFNPTQQWYWTQRWQELPEDLRKRALWPDSDPTNRYRGMTKFVGGGWAEVPIFNDEYAWMQDWQYSGKIRGDGQPWAGERAMKPWSPRQPNHVRINFFPSRFDTPVIGQHLSFLERIERETQAYRGLGIAQLCRWDWEYRLPEGPHQAVVAFLRESDHTFFADQPLKRTLYAVNDAEKPTAFDLEVRVFRLANDGRRSPVFSFPFRQTLARGEIVSRSFTMPAPSGKFITEFAVEVVRRVGQAERILQRQRWTFAPRSLAGEIPATATVALYDPQGTSAGLFEALGVKPTQVKELTELGSLPTRLLVIGEDAPATILNQATAQFAQFMRTGGTILALRQPAEKGIAGWLPLELSEAAPHWSTVGHRYAGSRGSLLAPNHPLFAGLLPDDLSFWAPHGLVFGTTYELKKPLPNARILVGLPPFSAQLIEGTFGSGRWLATTLELTPETVRVTPTVARLLGNLLRWTTQDNGAETRTAVVLGKPDSAAHQALRSVLKVQADFRSDEPALTTDVLILAGERVPSPEYADTVGRFVRAGGTMLVQQASAELAPWLARATGLAVTAEPAFANDCGTKVLVHPLLAGIGEGDLQWDNVKYDPKLPGSFASLLLRIPGAQELIAPAALTVSELGRGRVIVDQSRWFAATEKMRGLRYQATLLANLGLRLEVPSYGTPASRFALPPGPLAFTSIPLGNGANLALDRTGIDLSRLKDREAIAGVPFDLFSGPRSVLALASAGDIPADIRARYGKLPTESDVIPVKRPAAFLFFAQTAFYHQALAGETVLTYEVRYAGHERIIGGQDAGDLVISVQVRSETDLRDWFVTKGARPPANGAVFSTGSGNDALITIQRWDNPFPDRVIDSIVVRAVPTAKSQPFVLGITAAGR